MAIFHPVNIEIIKNMKNHYEESNNIIEPISKNNNFPIELDERFKSFQGTIGYSLVLINLFVNALNKNGQDDFTKIIMNSKSNSPHKSYKVMMFFNSVSTITTYVFFLENIFKVILEDKKMSPEYTLGNIVKQVHKLVNLSDDEIKIFAVLREMRNSFHGNLEFGRKDPIDITLGDYTYNFEKGKSTLHQFDYSSKIMLESSKIVARIMPILYP